METRTSLDNCEGLRDREARGKDVQYSERLKRQDPGADRRLSPFRAKLINSGVRVGDVVRLRVRLPFPCDPWRALDRDRGFEDAGPRFAWYSEAYEHAFAALGQVAVAEAGVNPAIEPDEDRFAAVRQAVDAVSVRTFELGLNEIGVTDSDTVDPREEIESPIPDGTNPLWVGGASFFPCAGREIWKGWPAARFILPKILIERRSTSSWICVLGRVGAQRPIESVEHSWVDVLIHRLLVVYQHVTDIVKEELDNPAERCLEPACSVRAFSSEAVFSDHDHLIWQERAAAAIAAIRQGQLKKLVLARARSVSAPDRDFDWLATLFSLRAEHAVEAGCASIVFGFSPDGGASFIGATPETLIDLRHGIIRTSALAGTAPRGPSPERSARAASYLLASEKEQEEHSLVVDALRQVLSKRCQRLEIDDRPSLRRLRSVQHLETKIRGDLIDRTVHVLDLCRAIHPTPAVGGWPHGAALQWLNRYEALERGWYAGPIGWFDERGDGHFAVALRSAMVRPKQAWVYAGAGLTKRSRPDAEWAETLLKLENITRALCLRG